MSYPYQLGQRRNSTTEKRKKDVLIPAHAQKGESCCYVSRSFSGQANI
jgi:hypothetical protein